MITLSLQVLQDYTPAEILKIVVGVITIGVALWQIWNIWRARKQQQEKQPPKEDGIVIGNKTAVGDVIGNKTATGDVVIGNKTATGGDALEMVEVKTPPEVKTEEVEQGWWEQVKSVFYPVQGSTVGMLVFAFLSGFTGGLIGVRGPPLIIFFFFWEYPKPQVCECVTSSENLV